MKTGARVCEKPRVMQNRHDEFLRRAREADEKASTAINPKIAAGWREIALTWREMAEQSLRTQD